MVRRVPLVILCLGLLAGALAAACGGGGGGNNGSGERVVDPAKVPTSTPVQNPVLYTIRQDGQIQTSGGPPITGVAGTGTPGAGSKTQNYTVAAGDTCGAIASKFGITPDDLRKANRSIDDGCTNLKVGDPLKIPAAATPTSQPGGTPKPGSGKTYVVQAGNTCSGIAQSYSVKVGDLIAANGLDADCLTLKVGQTLKIP